MTATPVDASKRAAAHFVSWLHKSAGSASTRTDAVKQFKLTDEQRTRLLILERN